MVSSRKQNTIFVVSGVVGPRRGSNQSLLNTIKGYLNDGFKVYHFAFYSKNNSKYDMAELLKYKNSYVFVGIPKILDKLIHSLIKVGSWWKSKKTSLMRCERHRKTDQYPIFPDPNETIKPHVEVTLPQRIFFVAYNIFETIRIVPYSLFLKPAVLYGYDVYGVYPAYVASKLVNAVFVKRFQGTFIDPDDIHNEKTLFHVKAYRVPCDLNVMTNDGTKGDAVLRRLGFSNDEILFLTNGIDERITRPVEKGTIERFKEELGLKEKTFIMGIFNRFYPSKRVDRAIFLVEQLRHLIPGVHLIVGGMGGPTESIIKKYVEERHLLDCVTFLGEIPYSAMYLYYHICDLVLVVNDHANLGNQIIELCYLGKMTLATNDGVNVKYFPCKNIYYIEPREFSEEAPKVVLEVYRKKLNGEIDERVNENVLKWNERIKLEIERVKELIKQKNMCNVHDKLRK